jgi:peptidoglycan/LPS O-acetylase OafA/YrhL
MKKILIPLMLLSILAAFYFQSQEDANPYGTAICFAVFMFGMMRLSAKTPSKHNEDEQV